MFCEVKALFDAVAFIFIAIVMMQIIFFDMMLGFLLLMSIGLVFMSDILILHLISKRRLKPQLDPTPRGMEACVLFTLTGDFDVINTVKKPHGKREFVYNKHDASIINRGDYQIRLPNGNTGFIGHELDDQNINLVEVKMAEEIHEEYKTDDLKEVYSLVDKIEHSKPKASKSLEEVVG